jgi:chromosome segregation protein
MIQFSRLRLSGFKSFVDQTELEIAPGLNGIVGPNGCGKSNLLEALRWAMGENSARRMRGDGMEDVIFNGTAKRSARNIAEVSILLDNSNRSAPAAYNNSDDIEITRRIERDHGSLYKINGKTVRARDVQMLFADTVTGANSPAMVSQGRVTQIINAKPMERRLILEESAGISGLYARRHEAELRLRAADANLQRIEDVFGSMDTRLAALKKQSRQATRYRNVNAQIRQMEILIAWLEWNALEIRMQSMLEKFNTAESSVAGHLGVVTQLTKTQTTQAQDLPALRKQEAELAAALQARKITLQRLEDDYQRHTQDLAEAQAQLAQTLTDQAHEQQTVEEAGQTVSRMEEEQKKILSEQGGEEDILAQKQNLKEELEQKVLALEEKYTGLMQSAAESKARKQALEQQIDQNHKRILVIEERKTKAQQALEALQKGNKDQALSSKLESDISTLNDQIKQSNEDYAQLVKDIDSAKQKLSEARTNLRNTEQSYAEFNAELSMLENLLSEGPNKQHKPVLDDISPDQGFEKALSRALGDTLLASLEQDAPARWVTRKSPSDMPALPDGIEPLLPRVKAPQEMHLALSQIGFIDADHISQSFVDRLKPGQSIVSSTGAYWRWDGYYVEAAAKDRNAQHLEHKNKLKALQSKRKEHEKSLQQAEKAVETHQAAVNALETKQRDVQQQTQTAQSSLSALMAQLGNYKEQQARFDSEQTRLSETIKLADEDIQTLREVIGWDQERLKTYENTDSEKNEKDIEDLRISLEEARQSYQAAVRAFDIFQQEQNSRKARLHAIADERINLQNRLIRARERLKQLQERHVALTGKLEELGRQPKNFDADRETLLSEISKAEAARNEAAEKLAACEYEVEESGKALREAESKLSEAREARAHAQATLAAIKEQQDTLNTGILEQFKMEPHQLKDHAAIDIEQTDENLESFKAKKDKLVQEREAIGPVNLRADEEAQELEAELGGLLRERNDLIQAIEELRGGIQTINKEARERLTIAFEHVNAHFQRLFVQLFGGGQAHLALIDGQDPLDAGLEIFAQPPGKTLQSLSLLSGGEQTLASIALIFAMFLTNPSPICVLDEIDAPLDDANVDRVCDLLEDIAQRGQTRFLIITHHRMTMARMDRLYGVTMAEKGISQLVSVDLQQSFDFLEEAA